MIGQSKIQKRPRRPKWVGLFVIVVALTVCEARAQAQQQGKMPKIGWLEVRPDDSRTSFELFKRELRALGYVDGRSIAFEYRNAGNNLDRLPALADELVRLRGEPSLRSPGAGRHSSEERYKDDPHRFCGRF